MGSRKMKLLLILSLIFAHAYYVEGIFCPWKVASDVKCACDDGGLVHPWDCCSVGACNVFCCNCGGPCRSNDTEFSKMIGSNVQFMILLRNNSTLRCILMQWTSMMT